MPTDRSGEVEGIEFHDLPQVEGDARAALDAYTLFEVEHWRALRDGEVPDALRLIASEDVLATVENQLAGNEQGGWKVGGTFAVQVRDIQGGEAGVLLEACGDTTQSTFTNADGTKTGADFGFEPTLALVELSPVPGSGWQVVRYEIGTGETC